MSRLSVLVTLAVLVAYAGASFVQLPFLNLAFLSELLRTGSAEAYARTSIVALGVMPWLSVCIMAEIAASIVPRVRQWPMFAGGSIKPFHRVVVGLTLLIAALQAYGVAVALEAAGLTRETGATLAIPAIVAGLIGGTVLTVLAARLIEDRGTGHGFWTLIAVGFVSLVSGAFGTVSQMLVQGFINDALLAVELLIISVAALATVWLTKLVLAGSDQYSQEPLDAFVWPIFVALQLAGLFVSSALVLFPALEFNVAPSGIRLISVLLAGAGVILLGLFLTLSLRRAGRSGAVVPACVVLIGLFLTPYMFELAAGQSHLVWRILSPLGQFTATIALLTMLGSRLLQALSSSPSTTRNRN